MPAHATPSRSFSGEGNAEVGVSPESVDYVMCTHLHVDHCGWDIRLLDGRWVPMFLTRSTCSLRPNTSTGMDRRERRARVYQDSVLAVIESGQAEIIDGQGAVGDRLMLHPTPGANSWPCGHKAPNRVFGGDLMHQPLQVFRPGWNSAFCENPVRARDSRRRLLERAAETLPRVQFAEWAEELVEGATWRCRQCSSAKQCLSENRPRWSRLGWSRKIVTLDLFPPISPA